MISALLSVLHLAETEEEEFDPTTVTPGWEGFLLTFLVAAAVVFLVFDMNRRIRRSRYREEAREELAAEEAAEAAKTEEAAAAAEQGTATGQESDPEASAPKA